MGLVQCKTEREAEAIKAQLADGGLELHPTKTKIVYSPGRTPEGPAFNHPV
jgi:hypothetical protein